MALLRIYPSKDTSIANSDPGSLGSQNISGSNAGAAEVMNLYKTYSVLSSSAEVLVAFPSSTLPSGSQVVLHLADAQHSGTLPAGYGVLVRPLEQDWTEGSGYDLDYYTDLGVANWSSASLTAAWAAMTGTASASFYFSSGHEDLDVDVTALAASASYGYLVEIDPSLTASDLYIKKFHSRQTHFPEKRPYLEVRWSDWTGNLSTSSLFMATSGAWSGAFVDPRLSGTMSGTTVSVTNSLVDPTGALVLSLYDLRPVYSSSEVVTLHLAVRTRDYNPAAVPSASAASGTVLSNAFYSVVDAVTEQVLVPFASGAIPYTRLSYNDLGDYFALSMSLFPTGTVLRIDFAYQVGSTTTVVPGDDFTFRVR